MIFESFSNRKDALTVVDSYGLQTYKVKSTFKTIDADDKIVLTQSSGLKPNLKNSMLLYDAKSWKYNAMNLEVEKIGKYIVEKHNLKMPVSIVELPLLPVGKLRVILQVVVCIFVFRKRVSFTGEFVTLPVQK